uniref:Uncharacterized protein n=2 Tax=Odontella aurita TaxID=265563 RepID=A0A7S4MQZ1_9STRA|mmetsp:Transcript_29286/g.86744  ORF Transcript_29286/g.86744 Transcript_29286/m.86744 type:complete len:321 (+) Transcript_29286:587-1549(+)
MIHKVTRSRDPGGRDRYDYKFTDPKGQLVRGTKNFLKATTGLVASELSETVKPQLGEESKSSVSSKKKARLHVSEQAAEQEEEDASIDAVEAKVDAPMSTIVPLPTMEQLLEEERGLAGALNADKLGIWNSCYGSDSDIALLILQSLSTGKLPHLVRYETPFFRTEEELREFPPGAGVIAPPTRFVGVTRMIERRRIPAQSQNSKQRFAERATGAFGVEFPIFLVKYDDIACLPGYNRHSVMDPPMPKPATAGGRKVLLRADIARDDVAGQLFAFMFRLLYGDKALSDALIRTNSGRTSFFDDTMGAFGGKETGKAFVKG